MIMHCVYPDTISTIDALRSVLTKIEHPLTVQELPELASRLQLPARQWRDHLTFDPHQFSCRTIYDSPHFEINIIGWRSGQFSSIENVFADNVDEKVGGMIQVLGLAVCLRS